MNADTKPYHHGNLADAVLNRAAEVIASDGIESLSLRGIARDLGVSHGAPNRHFKTKAALLSALATKGWLAMRDATLEAAELTSSQDPHIRLNAMGRGYLRWALNNRALFRTVYHPDVSRYMTDALSTAVEQFSDTVRDAVAATQKDGRHTDVPLHVLTIFTNAVPTGAAVLLSEPTLSEALNSGSDQEALIEAVINLVVPVPVSAK